MQRSHTHHRTTNWVAALTFVAMLSLVVPRGMADDVQLQAIASLAAAHVYTSYGYVGVTADAFVSNSFTAKQVRDLMGEVKDMIELNIEVLEKVRDKTLGDDREFIEELIKVYEMVKEEAAALVAYVKTGASDDAAAFEKARKSVWPYLKNILGIEE